MRATLAQTIRRVPSGSLNSVRIGGSSMTKVANGKRCPNIESVSSIRHFSASSMYATIQPSYPRFQADRLDRVDTRSSASSSKDSLPPSLIKSSPRRRNSRSGTIQNQQAQSTVNSQKKGQTSNQVETATEKASISSVFTDKATPQSDPTKIDSSLKNDQAESSSSQEETKKSLSERVKGLWENIKYLFRFYYNGVKQIWKDRSLVQAKRKEIAEREASGKGGILWSEKAMIELHEADVRKLPLFLAILIILEEVLPLVVIYAPSLLPSTCVLPSQSLKMRAEEERRRGLAIQRLAKEDQIRTFVDSLASTSCNEAVTEEESSAVVQSLRTLDPKVTKDIANVFGLRSWGPTSLVVSRIEKHIRFLQEDDELLQRAFVEAKEEKSSEISKQIEWNSITTSSWLWRACGRRGIRSSEADESTMQKNLEAYLHMTQSIKKQMEINPVSQPKLLVEYALLPLALYDGTPRSLNRLQGEATEEQSKGIRKRTQEVVESVVQEEKRKEGAE